MNLNGDKLNKYFTLPKQAIENALGKDVKELPTFPIILVKLLKLTSNESSSIKDLEKIVETDPAIAVKVLKIVNSAAFGPKQKINRLRDAIIYLGFSFIRKLAMEVTIFEQMIQYNQPSHFNRLFFWRHCLSVACISKTLAEALGYPDPEEVYVAGLLHDIGKIILDTYGQTTYSDFLVNYKNSNGLLIDEEKRLVGVSHDDIGAYFCHLWSLPYMVTLAVKFHHCRFEHLSLSNNDALIVSIISLCDFITWTQGIGSFEAQRQPILTQEIDKIINIETIDFHSLLTKMDHDIESIARFYNFTFPSSYEFRENLLRTTLHLNKINTEYYHLQKELKEKVESMAHIKKSLTSPHQSLDTKKIITKTLEAIKMDFSFDRLYILHIDTNSRVLKIKNVLDTTNTGKPLSSFQISLSSLTGGIIDCFRNNKPYLISGATIDELKILQGLQVKEIGIIPITNDNQVIGLIGVDNIVSENAIHPYDLSFLTAVASELGRALENAKIFETFREKATLDSLTQILNREAIENTLKKSFHKAKAEGIPLSVGLVDIDFFKIFNDTFGHLIGDDVLKLVAETMKKASRPNDSVGRYGGEEFIFILNDTSYKDAFIYGERLRRKIENMGKLFQKRFKNCSLTVSIGISPYDKSMKTQKDLIAKADKALYRAKELGKNIVFGISAQE
ncbi:MAG: HDOD domain-containing protein [Candidatus Brocadiaceae bacterium]|nr:HDOD domain-containing protein [Candidatus Brocadiaceae bacterium]